ncbi:hypothetical protein [Streptomyces iconiensis]|uniref:Transferase n=1 Tax=Streptomyces iconiensis TaxID=1384038 RepID=A0ABT7A5Y6_9ACTN|nr:hypothetical protein [Streptomyces iconiensis]MDJ1136762.1 hypothetical protein [Streptomyces iconiensis]
MSSTTDTVAAAGTPGPVPLAKPPAATRERPARAAKSPAPGKSQSAQRGPTADCTADIAGGLTFDVRLPEGTEPGQDPGLLLRLRPGPSGETETVRLPLAPVEDGAPLITLRAALPSTMPLSEGRWNVFLALDDQEPRRLAPGINDLRSLVDRTPREGRTWLGVRIPYATKHGNLSVRAWLRWPHAEAGSLRVMDGGLVLCGRLYGAEIVPSARLEARPRRGEAESVFAEVAAEGADFTAVLPYPQLADHQLWDLWLRPGEGEKPIRIARILDDVPDKKRIFTYPAQRIEPLPEQRSGPNSATTGPVATATPYYTLNNDLAVRIDREPEAGDLVD